MNINWIMIYWLFFKNVLETERFLFSRLIISGQTVNLLVLLCHRLPFWLVMFVCICLFMSGCSFVFLHWDGAPENERWTQAAIRSSLMWMDLVSFVFWDQSKSRLLALIQNDNWAINLIQYSDDSMGKCLHCL